MIDPAPAIVCVSISVVAAIATPTLPPPTMADATSVPLPPSAAEAAPDVVEVIVQLGYRGHLERTDVALAPPREYRRRRRFGDGCDVAVPPSRRRRRVVVAAQAGRCGGAADPRGWRRALPPPPAAPAEASESKTTRERPLVAGLRDDSVVDNRGSTPSPKRGVCGDDVLPLPPAAAVAADEAHSNAETTEETTRR